MSGRILALSTVAYPKLSLWTACIAASLLIQGCVEYLPAPVEYGPPPPPAPPQGEYAPPAPDVPPEEPSAPAPNASAPNASLDALVGPIALYPDPLIALILPAATVPGDITAASSYLVQYGDMSRIDSQPWDPSVRALAHYPTVVTWMAQNIAWTQALGSAFLVSPADVMNSIQSLRARARANGSLVSNPEQQVVEADSDIEILPAQPDVVYVPSYDPDVVYADGYYGGYDGPFFNYGPAYPAGIWLSYSFDWRRHRVWQGDRNDWHPHQGWHPPHGGGSPPPGAQPWTPKSHGPRVDLPPPRRGPAPRPRPMQGAPMPPPAPNRQPGHPLTAQPGRPADRQPAPHAGEIVRAPVQPAPAPRTGPRTARSPAASLRGHSRTWKPSPAPRGAAPAGFRVACHRSPGGSASRAHRPGARPIAP